jgi:hypothetical protein
MKARLAKKIAGRTFAFKNWDSNYQPYSIPQQQKMIAKTPYSFEAKQTMIKYGVVGKIPTEFRKCNPVKILRLMAHYEADPKNLKEYKDFFRYMKERGYNLY